jgi:hypothetical protein
LNTWLENAVRAVWRLTVAGLLVGGCLSVEPLCALDRTWIGGDTAWTDATDITEWNPNDEPDADDTAIFNTDNNVTLGSNNAILALTMSSSIILNTNDFDLDVNGLVQLVGSGTNLIVGGSTSQLNADSITINNLANLEVDGGTIQVIEETGNGLLDINAGGELVGHGTLSMTDGVAVVTTLIVNDGAITAQRSPLTIFGAPQVGTLSINSNDPDVRIDLDGAGGAEDGVVNVRRNQTLDLDIPLADSFAGTINLFHQATYDSLSGWTMNGGTINVDNGFIPASFPNPAIPAGVSIIAGGQLALIGGTINNLDTDGTLQFDTLFQTNAGNVVNNGHLIFNSGANIAVGSNVTMPTASSSLTVGAGSTVDIVQANFNIDGANTLTNVIIVESDGNLLISTTDYDPDQATNAFDGTITLNGGDIEVTTADAEFVMDGVLNMNSTNSDFAGWSGEPLDIGNDAGALDADVNIAGSNTSQFGGSVDFNSDADVNIGAGATLQFLSASTVNFDTVNGANNAEFTGAGKLQFDGTVNVNEAVTLNMVGGEIDLDGTDGQGNFINIDAPLVINVASMFSFGKVNGAGGVNTLDINNSVGTGVMTVNLDDADEEWTLNTQGVMNLVNDNSEAILLAGSDVNINGTVNVTGDVRTTARLDITGTVNIITAGQPLRLAGGNNTDDPNTISGGTISGVGQLGADTNKALHGFGTINTAIAFISASNLKADNGTLTINGAILDAGTVGTADDDGTLHVTNAWNNNVTTGVQLNGGTLSGGTITNDVTAGISGHGLVTARIINNTQLFASLGDTLIFETPGNDNDWDGTTNTGEIEAASVTGTDIELRNTAVISPAFGFGGTVRATNNNTVFTNGFALDFNPGSTLELDDTATYRSTESTDIGGTENIAAGANATIQVENNFFLTFETGSSTTLNGNLTLKNNNVNIEAGAVFNNGGGALIIPDGSNVVADNAADIGVLLDMQGGFRPGNSAGIGRIDLLDYQQANSGELFVELTGTSLNQFDRLVASGDVVLDGYLNIDIDEISPGVPFVPALGQTFNIITANTVTGAFDFADVSGMPAGLAFHIEYLSNAVQLQVVTEPFFDADFDDDGDVDPTDLAIWQGAYNLNQLGDADGDNDSDGRDFLIWQRQFGSAPLMAVSASTAVPEPASISLALAAILGFWRRQH